MSPISLTITQILVFCYTMFGAAQASTVARLWIRFRSHRLWWDDCWAVLAMLMATLMELALVYEKFPPVAKWWIGDISFTAAIWFARISIFLSIIRLIPPMFTLRKISEYAACSFLIICIGLLAPKIQACTSDTSWQDSADPECLFEPNIAISELIMDLAADLVLVAIPLHLLYGISLSKDKRRMLFLMFGATLLISVVSIVHVAFWLIESKIFSNIVPVTGALEAGTALAVANLGVLIPFFYQFIKRDGDFDSEPETHYRSVQSNGEIHIRRVSDLVSSPLHFQTDTGRVSIGVRFQETASDEENGHSETSRTDHHENLYVLIATIVLRNL